MAILVLDIAILAILGLEFAMIAKIQQGIHIGINDKDNITATAAISTGRAAIRYEFLTAERGLAMTTIARFDDNTVLSINCMIASFFHCSRIYFQA